MKLIPFLFLFSFHLNAAAPVSVQGDWVINTHRENRFEMVAQERTHPLLVGDILYYATSQGEVVALQRQGGYPAWKTSVAGSVNGALAYGRSKLYVGDNVGRLTALNTRDGSVAWTIKITSEWLSPAVIQRDKVCASTSAEEIYCFSEKDGHEIWHYAHRGDEKLTVRGSATPSIYGDMILQGFADGHIAALSLENGSVLWTKKLRTRSRFYDVDMPAYVDDKGVLVATFDGNLYALDRTNGSTQWIFAVGSHSGFLVEGDRFYFAGLNGFFYAMDRSTGSPLWKTSIESGVGLTPVRAGDLIIFATTGDPLYALNDKTGEVVWTRRLGAGTYSAPASNPTEGSFYVLSNYGNLFSFQVVPKPLCLETHDFVPLLSAFWPHSPGSQCHL
ncbi:MAG: PQQ-binding-like beta-propeller repeat protein [Deltaproteobacteria bacterium]|nr:PQQ-binding-like beta-propeller repeat protein [Deltaproteobacteria bacterium]MBI3293419.1 PQQ-binding-like beta-propeller repeat protein [Deltaproteobacteria bacterium]